MYLYNYDTVTEVLSREELKSESVGPHMCVFIRNVSALLIQKPHDTVALKEFMLRSF